MKQTRIPALRLHGREAFRGALFQMAILALFSICATAQEIGTSFRYKFMKGFLAGEGYTVSQSVYNLLAEGESGAQSWTFQSGLTYKIVAFSDDEDVTDIDLYAYYTNGTVYLKDDAESPMAAMVFTPYPSRELKILWKNYATHTPRYKSTVYLMIGYK